MKFLLKFAIITIALIAFVVFYQGDQYITVLNNDYKVFVLFMAALTLLNIFVKPILKLITLPLSCMTMGLFSFVVNFIIVYMADKTVDQFAFVNWKYTFLFSLAFSLANSVLDYFMKEDKKS